MSSAIVKTGLVVGGGVLGILAFVAYAQLIGPLPPWLAGQKGATSANDSPATAHGGSFSVHGMLDWTSIGNAYTTIFYYDGVNSTKPPTVLYLDGVDPKTTTNPGAVKVTSTTNWSLVLDYRGPDAQHPKDEDSKTTLSICTKVDDVNNPKICVVDNNAAAATLYLLPSLKNGTPAGSFTPEYIDRKSSNGTYGSIFYDLNACAKPDASRHPACDHPFTVSVSTYNATTSKIETTPYHCVDGECTIGIDYQ
jgi:hypothetical protein